MALRDIQNLAFILVVNVICGGIIGGLVGGSEHGSIFIVLLGVCTGIVSGISSFLTLVSIKYGVLHKNLYFLYIAIFNICVTCLVVLLIGGSEYSIKEYYSSAIWLLPYIVSVALPLVVVHVFFIRNRDRL